MNSLLYKKIIPSFSIMTILIATILWRYQPWMPTLLFGDDLLSYIQYLNGDCFSTPYQAFTATSVCFDKFRPVFALFFGGLFYLFGKKITFHFIVNIVLHLINSLIFFAIIFRLSRKNILISFMAAWVLASSRFALYQVTQVTGLIEGLGLFFFLIMMYYLIQFALSNKNTLHLHAYLFGCIGAEWLVVLTHERYLALIPWIVVFLFLAPNFTTLRPTQQKAVLSLAIMPGIFTILCKTLIWHVPFFMGTAGVTIRLDPLGEIIRFKQALLSIFGFNCGPTHLVGKSIATHPFTPGWILALLFTISWIDICILAKQSQQLPPLQLGNLSKQKYRLLVMFIVLIGLLLLPPIMTIRIEQRWLVEPLLVLFIITAYLTSFLENQMKQKGVFFFVIMAVTSIIEDSYLSKSFPNLFFVQAANTVKIVKRDIIDPHSNENNPLILIAPTTVCHWDLVNGRFFRTYGGGFQSIQCVDNEDKLQENIDSIATKDSQIYRIDSNQAVNITYQFKTS